jgi:hypothetical protein
MDKQDKIIEILKKLGEPKYLADRVLIIFDDLVGSDIFSNRKKSPYKKLATCHRHLSFSSIAVSQAYNELLRTSRIQFSCLVLFEIWNQKELITIYEENPVGMTFDDWLKVYKYCVKEKYAFMFINYQQEEGERITRNFDEFIFYESKF